MSELSYIEDSIIDILEAKATKEEEVAYSSEDCYNDELEMSDEEYQAWHDEEEYLNSFIGATDEDIERAIEELAS